MKILVTGGGGFLGQALCRGLRERGHEVVSFNRGHYPALEALGVQQVRGDLAQRDAVASAAKGCEAVFHNAAKAGAWGSYASYHSANVVGTQNVLTNLVAHVPKLRPQDLRRRTDLVVHDVLQNDSHRLQLLNQCQCGVDQMPDLWMVLHHGKPSLGFPCT